MDIINSLVALGGLALAGVSVILIYRSRHQPQSEALYNRQLDAATEAADALVDVNTAIDDFRFRKGIDIIEGEKERALFKKGVYEPKERLRRVLLRNSPFLPSPVFAELSEYLANVELALGEMETHEADWGIGRITQIARPWDIATATFAASVIAIRDFLGVGPLTARFAKHRDGQDPLSDPDARKKAREIVRLLERQYDRPSSPLIPTE